MAGDLDPPVEPTPPPRHGGGRHDSPACLERAMRERDEELRRLEREVHELRRQLRAIHTSGAWSVLRTMTQIHEALAPRGSRRDALGRAAFAGMRRLKRSVRGLASAARARRAAFEAGDVPIDPHAYAVVCLPIIEWSFRFQRPQQLMRRFARQGHRVFYAANHFHGGSSARTRPVEPNVVELILPGDPAGNVYHHMPTEAEADRMADAFDRLRAEKGLADAVVVVQLPFWSALAERLRDRFGWAVVYDCMDDHSGFHNNTQAVLDGEARLIASADLVVTSSAGLHGTVGGRARQSVLIRNACEYGPFAGVAPSRREPGTPPLIGYYGAIAEWFDGDLVAGLARLRPDWRFEMIGSTLAGDASMLEVAPNVRLLGERPYTDLPRLVQNWDAFIIPFKRVPLTEATNPVKVYEMLATGKPVVAVALPELVPIADEGLIQLAHDPGTFASALDAYLSEVEVAPDLPARRRTFASVNTWDARQAALAAAIDGVRPPRHRVDPPARAHFPHDPLRSHHARSLP